MRLCCCPARHRFQQTLKLGRLKAAWDSAVAMRSAEAWSQLGVAALELLDVEMAMAGEAPGVRDAHLSSRRLGTGGATRPGACTLAAYRMLGDASMVMSLDRIRQYEDKNLLAAHVLILLDRDHSQAQVRVLRTSCAT